MTSTTRNGRAALLVLAAGFGLSALPAHAQSPSASPSPWANIAPKPEAPEAADSEETAAEETPAKTPAKTDDAELTGLELDWSQLNADGATLANAQASKARLPKPAANGDTAWASNDKSNGVAAVSVKQSLSPFWDTRIGADMTVARQPTAPTNSELLSEKLANGGNAPQSSGTAWAAVTAPGVGSIWDKTAIEARVDPGQDQSKLGTSLSKSLPLGEQYSLTLQNGYNVIQQGGHSSLHCADCVNLSAVPLPGTAARPARNYQTEQSARLSIGDTGTSFIAGQTLSTTDDKWLRKVGAEQKLFGGVSITGTVAETPQGATNKSVTAGFKRSW